MEEGQLTFDQLVAGDEIENFEEGEYYIVLYDRHNSTIGDDAVIVDVYRFDEKEISRTLMKKEFNNKHLTAFRG